MSTEGQQEVSTPCNYSDNLADGGFFWCAFLMITWAVWQITCCFLKSLPFDSCTHIDRPKQFTWPHLVSKGVGKNNPILEDQELELSGQEY